MQYNNENISLPIGGNYQEDGNLKNNNWDFIFSESLLKTQKIMEDLRTAQLSASALAMSQAWKLAVPTFKIDGAYAALNEIVARHKEWQNLTVPTDSLAAMAQSVLAATKVDTINLAASALELIDTSTFEALRNAASMAALAKADWSWLDDVKFEDNEEDIQESAPAKVSPEICSQIAADITEVLSDPENMRTTSHEKYLDWVRERPENAMLFWQTLCQIIQTIFVVLSFAVGVWQARPVKDAQVYEEPTATSSVVYNLTIENNVTVIGDVPYFYEVEFVVPETGEPMIGYVYKGNLVADESEETVAQEEVPEVTEKQEEATEATENPETLPVATEERVVALE